MITGLTQVDKAILNVMIKQKLGLTAYMIARNIGFSYNHIMFRIRILKDRGLVNKSMGGRYFINPAMKKVLIQEEIIEVIEKGELDGNEEIKQESGDLSDV